MNGDFAKRFHHQTTALWRRIGLPPEKDWPEEWSKASFKTYPRFTQIPLTAAVPLEKPLDTILASRHTTRSFDKEAYVSIEELSTVLAQSAGIRTKGENKETSKRLYPSGGRRYPLEIYISAERVTDLKPGIYHFNVRDNSLELLLDKKACGEFKKGLGYPWSRDASLSLLITGVWDRSFSKYQDFGYRFIHLEAGHLTQNIQLVSESLGLNYASVAGFREKDLDGLLDLDPDAETSIYMTVIGRAKDSIRKTP